MRNYLSRRNEDFGLNFFDAFDDFFKPMMSFTPSKSMRTDIKETENGYELSVDMPGFDKKDINLSLDNGYLKIEANKSQKEDEDKYIHRERTFSCSRSYYVGSAVTEEDVKAKYLNGTLVIEVPKPNKNKIEKRNISID